MYIVTSLAVLLLSLNSNYVFMVLFIYLCWTAYEIIKSQVDISRNKPANKLTLLASELDLRHNLLFFLIHKVHYILHFLVGVFYSFRLNILNLGKVNATHERVIHLLTETSLALYLKHTEESNFELVMSNFASVFFPGR